MTRDRQPQISTTDRTHARTGPDKQRAQAHNHTQNSNPRTQPRRTSCPHAHTHTHLPPHPLRLSHPHARAHPKGEPSPARSPPTSPQAPPSAASPVRRTSVVRCRNENFACETQFAAHTLRTPKHGGLYRNGRRCGWCKGLAEPTVAAREKHTHIRAHGARLTKTS